MIERQGLEAELQNLPAILEIKEVASFFLSECKHDIPFDSFREAQSISDGRRDFKHKKKRLDLFLRKKTKRFEATYV